MRGRISCRVDPELDRAILDYGQKNGLTHSQAVRELLRQIVTQASPVTRGWHEGFAKGVAEANERAGRALAGAEPPG